MKGGALEERALQEEEDNVNPERTFYYTKVMQRWGNRNNLAHHFPQIKVNYHPGSYVPYSPLEH